MIASEILAVSVTTQDMLRAMREEAQEEESGEE